MSDKVLTSGSVTLSADASAALTEASAAAEAASNAQTTANNAQTTASNAATTAGNAQTTAGNAATAATEAAKTATNYLTERSDGSLVVGAGNQLSCVVIEPDSIEIQVGTDIYGKFATNDLGMISLQMNRGSNDSVLQPSDITFEDNDYSSYMSAAGMSFTHNDSGVRKVSRVSADGIKTNAISANSADITQDLSVGGSIEGNLFPNFAFSAATLVTSKSIAAEGYTEGSVDISKEGYYPLAIIGSNVNTRYCVVNRAYITDASRALGSGTINFMVANHHSSAHTVTAYVYVIWVKG